MGGELQRNVKRGFFIKDDRCVKKGGPGVTTPRGKGGPGGYLSQGVKRHG